MQRISNMQLKLAELRNLISLRQIDASDIKKLKKIKKEVLNCSGPFSGLMSQAIENCLKDIERSDFKAASHEIHLIHNLPINMQDVKSWDEAHFYKIELLSYLENVTNVEKIKMLIANKSSGVRSTFLVVEKNIFLTHRDDTYHQWSTL